MPEAPDLSQTQTCGGGKHVSWDLNPSLYLEKLFSIIKFSLGCCILYIFLVSSLFYCTVFWKLFLWVFVFFFVTCHLSSIFIPFVDGLLSHMTCFTHISVKYSNLMSLDSNYKTSSYKIQAVCFVLIQIYYIFNMNSKNRFFLFLNPFPADKYYSDSSMPSVYVSNEWQTLY